MKIVKDKELEKLVAKARKTKSYKDEIKKIKEEQMENGKNDVNSILIEMIDPVALMNRWGTVNNKMFTILKTYAGELERAITNERAFVMQEAGKVAEHKLRIDYTSAQEDR